MVAVVLLHAAGATAWKSLPPYLAGEELREIVTRAASVPASWSLPILSSEGLVLGFTGLCALAAAALRIRREG
jgi:hypothetical protein